MASAPKLLLALFWSIQLSATAKMLAGEPHAETGKIVHV
jgi:hypothetical protein